MTTPITGRFTCHISELRLDKTLVCGQSFRWKELSPGIWTGVLFDKIWRIWQTESTVTYQVYDKTFSKCSEISSKGATGDGLTERLHNDIKREIANNSYTDTTRTFKSFKKEMDIKENLDNHYESLLKDYFQLGINLSGLYSKWSKVDPNFKSVSSKFEGIRILRQDPVENLFSFICSSNNHISRISGMIEKLCENYGKEVGELEGKVHYGFPSISALAEDGVETELRNLGFGYRAKYINESARYVMEKGEKWLYSLREMPYKDAKRELTQLMGVGAKVADCVCLMSLDKTEAVPVDTHVWQIASRSYMPHLHKHKSLTDKLYNEIGDHFRELWGPYAGWAHSVLFTADLKQFQEKTEKSPSKRKKLIEKNEDKKPDIITRKPKSTNRKKRKSSHDADP